MPDYDYSDLRAALTAPAAPPPPPKRPLWRRLLKWGAIGCASWFGLLFVLVVLAAIFGPDTPPAPPAATTTADTVATALPAEQAAPPTDTIPRLREASGEARPLGVAAPALPVAAPPPPAATPPVVEEAPPPPVKQQKSITVYTTRTGSKYHRSGCSSLRKSREATTLSEARSWGYEPCGRCRPPR